MIIMAAIVEWAHKAKSRPHITVGVRSERLCSYVVTSKLGKALPLVINN